MIKLKCINENCNFSYSVSEKEFLEYGKIYHNRCMICGSKLEDDNLKEIVEKDLYQRAEDYINKWVAEIGWDRTLDLIKNNKNQACARLYFDELKRRGFTIKEDE